MVDVSIQKRPYNAEGDEIQVKFPTVATLETGNTENEIVLISQDGKNAIMPNMLDFMLKKLDEMLNPEGNITIQTFTHITFRGNTLLRWHQIIQQTIRKSIRLCTKLIVQFLDCHCSSKCPKNKA